MQCLLLTQTGHGPLRIAAVQNGGGTEKVRSRHRLRTSPRIPIFKTIAFPQLIPLWENWRMRCTETPRIAVPGLVVAAMILAVPANATTLKRYGSSPDCGSSRHDPAGRHDGRTRYLRRFPQPARVGHLIGMPVLDLNSKTLGYVQKVVRTSTGEIEFTRWLQPLVGVVRATDRGATGSARNRRRASGVARYVTQRIRRCTDLACHWDHTSSSRRNSARRAVPQLTDGQARCTGPLGGR
jgi:hypothetical protein